MLAESKQKTEAISQAYSVLHGEYTKIRNAQARSHQHQSRHSIAVPFDHPATGVGVRASALGVMDGSMFSYQDLSNYTI